MKRIMWALPVVAAWVLVCLPALAGDSAMAAILPEPVTAHWLVAMMAVIVPALRTGLSADTIKLPTKAAPWRMAMIAILSAATVFFDGLMNGFALKTAMLALLVSGLPSIVQEILKVVFGPGSGGSVSSKAFFPPAAMLVLMLVAGCGAGKIVCPIIDVAAELCPLIAVRLPDGTTEMVPRDAIMGVTMQARAARVAGAKAQDAGADQ